MRFFGILLVYVSIIMYDLSKPCIMYFLRLFYIKYSCTDRFSCCSKIDRILFIHTLKNIFGRPRVKDSATEDDTNYSATRVQTRVQEPRREERRHERSRRKYINYGATEDSMNYGAMRKTSTVEMYTPPTRPDTLPTRPDGYTPSTRPYA